MKQRNRRLAFAFGGTLLATLAALAACSTDNGNTPTPGPGNGVDSGRKDAKVEDKDADEDEDETDGGKKPADGGADCAKVPELKASTGPYCFGVADAGPDGSSKGVNCSSENHEICCSDGRLPNGDFAASECKQVDTEGSGGYKVGACNPTFEGDGGKEYHCSEADHCPGAAEACCAIPAAGATDLKPGTNNDFPGCKAYYQSPRFVGGSRCKKNGCAPGELTLCSKDDQCPAGAKCFPLELDGRYTGYCRVN